MTGHSASQDQLAAVDGSAYPLSGEECVFRTRKDDAKHVMTFDVLRAMDICSRFRTFDEHVKNVTRRQGKLQGQEAAVRQVLDNAVRRGLFVSARDWLAEGGDAAPRGPDDRIPVFIRASGRQERLEALLDSAVRLEAATGRRHRYIAVEDGATSDARSACRRVVREARERGLDCRLLDLDWQRDFARRVAERAGESDPAVLSVLTGDGTGAGRVRNLVGLAAAGAPHLMLDDDRSFPARRDPSAPAGVALDRDATQWSLWFHETIDEARSWGGEAGLDPVAEHYRFLGMTNADALRHLARGPDDLAGLDFRAVERMSAGEVLATQSGVHGATGAASNIEYYLARGESLKRFQADEEAYRRVRDTGYLTRVRDAHALQSVASTGPVGAASHRPLPPTLPDAGRGGAFYAAALHALHPRSRVLEFPWTLGRFPADGRPEPAWEAPFTGDLSGFLAAELAGFSAQVPEVTGEARYRALAERLAALSAQSDDRLLDRVVAFQTAARTEWVRRLNDARRRASRSPMHWERDLKAIIAANGRSLERGVPRRVAGMPETLDDAGAAAWLRGRIEPLSRALAAWPALWNAALAMGVLETLDRATP